jgi:hypothetical protein
MGDESALTKKAGSGGNSTAALASGASVTTRLISLEVAGGKNTEVTNRGKEVFSPRSSEVTRNAAHRLQTDPSTKEAIKKASKRLIAEGIAHPESKKISPPSIPVSGCKEITYTNVRTTTEMSTLTRIRLRLGGEATEEPSISKGASDRGSSSHRSIVIGTKNAAISP